MLMKTTMFIIMISIIIIIIISIIQCADRIAEG